MPFRQEPDVADSALITLIKSDLAWPEKRDAMVEFGIKPRGRSEGPNDPGPAGDVQDSWDDISNALIWKIITEEQVDEVVDILHKRYMAANPE